MADDHDHPHSHHHDHGHDHGQEVPEDTVLRVKALESLLVEKGLVDPAALDAIRQSDGPFMAPPLDPAVGTLLGIAHQPLPDDPAQAHEASLRCDEIVAPASFWMKGLAVL